MVTRARELWAGGSAGRRSSWAGQPRTDQEVRSEVAMTRTILTALQDASERGMDDDTYERDR